MNTEHLQRYLRNECSPEEAQVVLAFLATEEGQRQLQALLTKELQTLEALPLDIYERQHAQRLFERIKTNKKAGPKLAWSEKSERRFVSIWRWAVAASVAFLLLATGSWWLYQRNLTPELITLTTDYGQIRRVTLPDQSIVTMNGNSSIQYAKAWPSDKPRQIWVKGEAFLEVVHTQNHQPFQVKLPGQMKVEVLGTRFNVYTRASATKVVLNEGRIQLCMANNAKNRLEMKPGEMFFADSQAKVFYKKPVDAQVHSSWRTNKLIFSGTTLAEIATLLHDTYGLQVDIKDTTLRAQKFSGTIPSRNAATILKGLSTLFDLKITQHNNHVQIE